MPEQVKRENIKRWQAKGDDEYRKRALGEMVTDSILMYPSFAKDIHGAIKFEDPRTEVQKILTENDGIPPREWCRYMVVDPGHAVCAVTFWTVPPDSLGDYKICYDELYIQQCTAVKFAEAAKQKVGDMQFQSFIIDAHGGRLREIGSGVLPRTQYTNELAQRGVVSIETGSRFRSGSDDVPGREMRLRDWLRIRGDGNTP